MFESIVRNRIARNVPPISDDGYRKECTKKGEEGDFYPNYSVEKIFDGRFIKEISGEETCS